MIDDFIEKIEYKNLKRLLIDKGIITQQELDDKMKEWNIEFKIGEFKPLWEGNCFIKNKENK